VCKIHYEHTIVAARCTQCNELQERTLALVQHLVSTLAHSARLQQYFPLLLLLFTSQASLATPRGSFSAVKRKVAGLVAKAKAPKAPSLKVVDARAEREVAYEATQKDMGKWNAPVQVCSSYTYYSYTCYSCKYCCYASAHFVHVEVVRNCSGYCVEHNALLCVHWQQ
jgi:hypothetical protein